MAAMDDLKAAVGAVADDVKRIADDVAAVKAKLAQSNDPAVQQAAEMLRGVDADLDSAAEAMEAAVSNPPPTAKP